MSLKTDFEFLNSVETLSTMGTSEVVLNAFYIMKGHELLRASEWSVMMCVRNVSHRLIHLNTWLQLWLTYLDPIQLPQKGHFKDFYFLL